MTDFVLPSQADIRAVDLSTLVIDEDTPGLLTPWLGALIKNFVDQMTETEIIHIRAPNTSTGKTEKFILENVDNLDNCPTIVTTDYFMSMRMDADNTVVFMNTEDFMTVIDNNPKVYRNFMSPWIKVGHFAAADVNKSLKNAPEEDSIVIDITADPDPVSDAEILASSADANLNPAIILNANDDALGTAEDDFNSFFAIFFGNDTGSDTGRYNSVWDAAGNLRNIPSMYNNLPVNGALLVLNYTLTNVQTAVQALLAALDGADKTYSINEYSPAEGEPVSAVAIKKLSI